MRELTERSNILKDPDNRHFGAVNPGAEAGIAAVVMGKLVGQHSPKLRDREHRKQGQAKPHDAPAAKAHDAPAVCHESIGVRDQVNVARQALVEGRGDVVEFGEEPALVQAEDGHSGCHEFVASGHQ